MIGQNPAVGSWGVGIFSNDEASDVREDFRDLRLPALLNPWSQRSDDALGFILTGNQPDPHSVQVLGQVADERTPVRRWQSQFVVRWSDLEAWFGPDGSPQWP